MTTEEGNYILKSKEASRLSNQHDVIKDEMGGLVLAPIDLPAHSLRILDSAAADGTWIRDLALQYDTVPHEFVGIDIDASNWPKSPPEYQTYQVQDITKPWPAEWKERFDLVHQRLALAVGGPIQKHIVFSVGELVKPGGWIQLIEATNETLESHGPVFRTFVAMIKGTYAVFGSSFQLIQDFLLWLKEAGFVNVQHRDINTKLGAINPNPQLAKQGVYSTTVAARGLADFGSTLPEGAFPSQPSRQLRIPVS